jgi:hypothetical protein
MKTTIELFEINKISFNNYSDEFSLKGIYSKNNLSYETELRLSQSILNQLMNQLQKLNQEVEISELLEIEYLPNGESHYALCTSELINTLPFNSLVTDRAYRQIRA